MKILIPLDGSALALGAVRHAVQLVHHGLRASFVLANVEEPAGVVDMVLMPDPQAREELNQRVGAEALDGGAALLDAAGLNYEREVRTGYAKPTLVDIAEDFGCDAIIMSAHGAGAVRSALLGSVSQALLGASVLPITIVRQSTAGSAG
jgi:nucleotide-binding universal stress UspA family protein